MGPGGANQKPSFFWQGALIVLPVAALAAVGVFSLRQDKALARHDATEKAQAIAEILCREIWDDLAKTNKDNIWDHGLFEVDSMGRLISPPPCDAVPEPGSFDVRELNEDQALLWSRAQRADAEGSDPAAAVAAYREFLDSGPAKNFAAVATYASGVLLTKTGKSEAAAEMFRATLQKYPDAVAESGLPLRPLAQWKLLELRNQAASSNDIKNGGSWSELCSDAVMHPTALTPSLIELAVQNSTAARERDETRTLQAVWQRQELSRQLFSAAKEHLRSSTPQEGSLLSSGRQASSPGGAGQDSASPAPGPKPFWFRLLPGIVLDQTSKAQAPAMGAASSEDDWLATALGGTATSHRYLCRSESELGARLAALVETSARVPDYFGIAVELAGKRLTRFAPDLRLWRQIHQVSKGGGHAEKQFEDGLASEVLGSTVKSDRGVEQLRVLVYLTSPATLFQHQRARTFWFGALITASAAAAFIGFLAAYRAFHRQLRLSELKSNFVSSVSHELRAPIASVRLMAESLHRGKVPDPPRQQEYFRFIVQECRRLSSLIENVLDFSRIERGRKQYDFEPTDLVALVRQTAKLMETYAAEHEITLELQLENFLPETRNGQPNADGKALQQALVNLIDNAIKHSAKGGRVVIGLEVQNANENAQQDSAAREPRVAPSIVFWVEDYGEGIPAAEHQKIFERFYRCGSELRRETQGVGIGLSIVKHIVEAHGGRVLVRSEVGHGSRFTIELPAATWR